MLEKGEKRTSHVTSSSFDSVLPTSLEGSTLRGIVIRVLSVRLGDRAPNWGSPINFIRTLSRN
jgi:hypothetical protein